MRRIVVAAIFAVLCAPAQAESSGQLVDTIARQLEQGYVFPAAGAQAGQSLRARLGAGRYRGLEGEALARALSADLQSVTRDKHLAVHYSAQALPQQPQAAPGAAQHAQFLAGLRRANFGAVKVERLDDNIGYFELREFAYAPEAGGTIAAAMSFLQHTDALIIDLRRNGGGDPHTVALLASYLLDPAVELNAMYWRAGERTQQFWTSAWLPAPRYGSARPVYLLTSARTFSAAEDFAYALANLKRVTIVGETTGGGAHPGGMVRLGAHYEMFLPGGRSVSPVTGGNWEGSGVRPDLAAPAADALALALRHVRARLAGPAPAP